VLVLVVLLAVGLGALYALLPGLVEGPAVRERIEAGARDATGREFRYETLSFGILPPRLRVVGPSLAGEAEGDPPFAEASEVSLRVALLPLLSRTLVLEKLVVEAPTVRLVRDASGLRLPEREAPDTGEPPAPREPREDAPAGDGGVSLAVKEAALRGARILFEDRSVSPPAQIEIGLDARAALSPSEPTELELEATLGGGSIAVEGRADLLAQQAEWTATLEGIDLGLVAPYLSDGRTASGRLSGTVTGTGEPASPALSADLRLADGAVQIRDIGLRGPLTVQAELSGGDEPRSGRFEVDATDAALDAYEGAYRKPAGKPGSVKGRFLEEPDGDLAVDDLELKIHNLDARGRVELGDRVQAELSAAPFDLAGWDELVPALAEYRPAGRLSPGTLRVATEPLSLRGRINFDAVRLVLPEEGGAGPEIALQGALEGTGDALKLVDLVLTTGGETVRLGGELAGLSQDRMRYRLALDADGAETNVLASAFTALDDQIYGPLFLDTDLTGRTGDPEFETLAGRLDFAVRPGKIEGVSPLQLTVAKLGSFGEAALLAAALDKPERGKKIERYYGDEFEELAGTFDLAGGWARTRNLRLVYDGYRVDLVGGYRVADQRLDFQGTLTLEPEVDEALADAAAEGGDAAPPEPRVIELAEVRGTLDDPKIDLSSRTVRAWVGGYTGRQLRDKYQDKLDRKLGEELGGEVGDLVEGLFGGKKKR